MYSYEIDIVQHSSRRSGRSFRGYASLRGIVAVRGHQLVLQPRHPHRQHHRFICNGTACQLLQRESSPSDGYGRRLRRVYNIQHICSSERYSSSKRTVRFRRTLHLGDRPPVHRLRLPRLLCRRKTEIAQSLPLHRLPTGSKNLFIPKFPQEIIDIKKFAKSLHANYFSTHRRSMTS